MENNEEKKPKQYGVRTDLAVEARDMYVEKEKPAEEVPGVSVKEDTYKDVKISHMRSSLTITVRAR